MARSRHPDALPDPGARPVVSNDASRGLTVAVAICGALAGASIIEAVAAVASQSPITLDHLVAAPLILLGALAGGLLAVALVRAEYHVASERSTADSNVMIIAESIPGLPTTWQPTPLMASASEVAQLAPTDGAQPHTVARDSLAQATRRPTYARHHMGRHAPAVARSHACPRHLTNP